MRIATRHACALAASLACLAMAACDGTQGKTATGDHVVSQVNATFSPGHLGIKAGDVVDFVNDDGRFHHHVYVASDAFSFDSDDQAPGQHVRVKFTTPGTFNVLCGIHPKMKLKVEVSK